MRVADKGGGEVRGRHGRIDFLQIVWQVVLA